MKQWLTAAYRGGRTADAWRQALEQTWVRLKLSPAPPTGAHYDSLRPIMDVPGGIDGEVEAYMLGLGGLDAQVQILADNRQERRTVCEQAGLGAGRHWDTSSLHMHCTERRSECDLVLALWARRRSLSMIRDTAK